MILQNWLGESCYYLVVLALAKGMASSGLVGIIHKIENGGYTLNNNYTAYYTYVIHDRAYE